MAYWGSKKTLVAGWFGRDLQCETGLGLAWEVGVSLEGVLERWSVLTWRFMGSYKWGYK